MLQFSPFKVSFVFRGNRDSLNMWIPITSCLLLLTLAASTVSSDDAAATSTCLSTSSSDCDKFAQCCRDHCQQVVSSAHCGVTWGCLCGDEAAKSLNLSTGVIIGISIAAIIVLALCIACIIWCICGCVLNCCLCCRGPSREVDVIDPLPPQHYHRKVQHYAPPYRY